MVSRGGVGEAGGGDNRVFLLHPTLTCDVSLSGHVLPLTTMNMYITT